MIAQLNGIFRLKLNNNNNIIVEVNGVGYLVEISNNFIIPEEGNRISIFVYTYVREDSIILYGFKELEERELFKILISVSGIGPKAAMNILSTLSYERFISSLLNENIEVLTQVSGIGFKTAKRLIFELKNKLDNFITNLPEKSIIKDDNDDIFMALKSLGYTEYEIDKALNSVKFNDEVQVENKIKKVLTFLGKEKL
jgi:holliday junction DNA helicase RuvA